MKQGHGNLDWASLIGVEPSAALIPRALRELAKQVDTETGETLFRIGNAVRYIHLVINGEARLTRLDHHGNEIILQRSRHGFIAEASLDSRAYHCNAVTVEPSTMLLFPAGAFRTALEDEPAFRKGWQSLLAQEIRKLRAQCERLSLHSAVDRISHYVASEGTDGVVNLNQTRKSWAAELGLSHEATYRALKRMQDQGLLEVKGRRLTFKPLPEG